MQEAEGRMSATLQRALTAGLELNWQSRQELMQEAEGRMSATLQRALATGLELNWQSRQESIQEAEGRMSATLQRALATGLELKWQSRHELIQLLADILYGRDHYQSAAQKSGLARSRPRSQCVEFTNIARSTYGFVDFK